MNKDYCKIFYSKDNNSVYIEIYNSTSERTSGCTLDDSGDFMAWNSEYTMEEDRTRGANTDVIEAGDLKSLMKKVLDKLQNT